MTSWVEELCAHCGIHSGYRGYHGETVVSDPEIRLAVLASLGHEVSSDAEARDCLETLKQVEESRPAPPEVIVDAGQSHHLDLAHQAEWRVEEETSGRVLTSGTSVGRTPLSALPMGIHRLIMTSAAGTHESSLIARPKSATLVGDILGSPKAWGVSASLFGLTDGGTTSLGNYRQLGEYAASCAVHGADYLGINPVHAMGQVRPRDVISPYSPSHRGFLNTWHVDAGDARFPQDIGAGPMLIDYQTALDENMRGLKALYREYESKGTASPDAKLFAAFETARGPALTEYALFEVLASEFGGDWRHWPTKYRDKTASALAAFLDQRAGDVSFFKWAQWQADQQLRAAQTRTHVAGMGLGLYLDIAVGPRLGGAESWCDGSALAVGVEMGAPPDPLSATGQRWGIAPLSPALCRQQQFAGFANILRSTMRHAGMVRIDHVLGLQRGFWIPEGSEEGAYVNGPIDAYLAIIAIESQRNETVVIGEDLGLVPEGLREKLANAGIYGMDILQYDRDEAGGFRDTRHNREKAICVFGTHDTPTIAGFFKARDAQTGYEKGQLGDDQLAECQADRLRAFQSLGPGGALSEIHGRLASARSDLVAVQMDDITGEVEQQNVPGTVDEHPNWRRPARLTAEELCQSEDLSGIGRLMAQNGRGNLKKMEIANDDHDSRNLAH